MTKEIDLAEFADENDLYLSQLLVDADEEEKQLLLDGIRSGSVLTV